MARIRVKAGQVGKQVRRVMLERLKRHASGLGEMVVAQARQRINNKGDTTHRYPELWDHPGSYRKGGQPLRDTGLLFNGLTSEATPTETGIKVKLISNQFYAVYHQQAGNMSGEFKTAGPNFIPLTRKAKRLYDKFQTMLDRGQGVAFDDDGNVDVEANGGTVRLIKGKDFIMAWQGVTVPQRKIFNLPPEDVAAIASEVRRIAAGRAD
jgi:phage gpG-like protein